MVRTPFTGMTDPSSSVVLSSSSSARGPHRSRACPSRTEYEGRRSFRVHDSIVVRRSREGAGEAVALERSRERLASVRARGWGEVTVKMRRYAAQRAQLFCRPYSAAYVSFGGLLMRLQGDPNNLHGFEVDNHVYLLMKKIAF
ncbi:hypothetical protein HPB51_022884 [Rhipicephalus microplus]|uniref:DNA-directed RNA polymerases I, II, and III subunit RPABC3 n=1 Tax=Rhipicephalus microplus TaxID=6941 RepID=A0A9J6DRC6_RHIMP|nr:hypothetical protein HPB51_022884 [Rhipicephalus microplus]